MIFMVNTPAYYVRQMGFCMSTCNVSVPSFDLLGSTILLWFMRICTEHETKFEHDRSHSLLKKFLKTKKLRMISQLIALLQSFSMPMHSLARKNIYLIINTNT